MEAIVNLYQHGTTAQSTLAMWTQLCESINLYNHGNNRLIKVGHVEYMKIITKVHRPTISSMLVMYNLVPYRLGVTLM